MKSVDMSLNIKQVQAYSKVMSLQKQLDQYTEVQKE